MQLMSNFQSYFFYIVLSKCSLEVDDVIPIKELYTGQINRDYLNLPWPGVYKTIQIQVPHTEKYRKASVLPPEKKLFFLAIDDDKFKVKILPNHLFYEYKCVLTSPIYLFKKVIGLNNPGIIVISQSSCLYRTNCFSIVEYVENNKWETKIVNAEMSSTINEKLKSFKTVSGIMKKYIERDMRNYPLN